MPEARSCAASRRGWKRRFIPAEARKRKGGRHLERRRLTVADPTLKVPAMSKTAAAARSFTSSYWYPRFTPAA